MSEVLVTGLGFVGTAGLRREALEAALAGASPTAPGPQPLPSAESAALRPRPGGAATALRVEAPDLTPWIPPRAARRLSRPSRFAVAAARMALEDAGLDPQDAGETTGVYAATTYGPPDFTERLLRQIRDDGPQGASPFYFTESVANAPAAQVALACRARGPNLTLTQREAGPLLALAQGATALRRGRAQRALVVVAEEATPLLHAFLDHFRALARPGADPRRPREAARPLDRHRDGFLLAEGAIALVLERADAQRLGDRPPLARIEAWSRAFDPTAPRHGHGQGGEALAQTLTAGLQRHGVELDTVHQVVSGASGALAGDALEASVLHAAFDHRPPPLFTPKALLGEYAGGHLGAAVLAAAGRPLPSAPTDFVRDSALDLAPHPESLRGPQQDASRRVLATSLAAGGAAAWAVLDAPR